MRYHGVRAKAAKALVYVVKTWALELDHLSLYVDSLPLTSRVG